MGDKIKVFMMDCPVCGKRHEVEEYTCIATTEIKGEEVDFEEHYLYCSNADEDECRFAMPSMLNANLMRARDAYRAKHGLLTSKDIVAIREAYGLSQVDLARLLGWGEATISRYESKAIQDDAYDDMLRLIKDDPLRAMDCLKRNAELFSAEKYESIKNNIADLQRSYGDEYLSRAALRGFYVEYDEPSDLNGDRLLDIDKTELVISYFAEYIDNLYKVKLMKMLWYADALSYKRTGKAITGLVYYHEAMGALPKGHYALMNLDRLNIQEEFSGYDNMMIHIYPTAGMDYNELTDAERSVLNEVITKFREYRASDIIEYMHAEKAYTSTKTGEIIPFSLAAKIREF